MSKKEFKTYTNDELLKILKEQCTKDKNIKTKDFKVENGLPRYQLYLDAFGSWSNAKKLIGISVKKIRTKKVTKELLIEKFKNIVNNLDSRIPSYNELVNYDFPSPNNIYKYFQTYDDFVKSCDLNKTTFGNGKYKKDFLIGEIQRFVKEFKRIPIAKDFEKLDGYPSRKTFSNHFGSFNEAIIQAGFEPVYNINKKHEYYKKENIVNIVKEYIRIHNEVPTMSNLIEQEGHIFKYAIKQSFGTWNKCLLYMNIPLNSISHYDDEFLHCEFERFVKEHTRIPKLHEFNTSEYPSFWCYQARYGSWNNAVMSYGYEPNDMNRKYYLDDGEICASSYEYDISLWLKENKIKYVRDVDYKNFIDGYKGKMNCDYVISYNNQIWYVEMAGFLRGNDFSKYSEEEKKYFFKLMYKKKLLKRQKVNYLIIEASDFKRKSLQELFYFININQNNNNNTKEVI